MQEKVDTDGGGAMRQADLRDRIEELEVVLEKVADELKSLHKDIDDILGSDDVNGHATK